MIKKHVLNTKGLTLIELIVTLAIFGMVLMIAYPMLTFTYRVSDAQLKESSQRDEVRVASSYLKSDVEYSKDLTVIDSSTLHVINKNGESIDYNIEINSDGNSLLIRKGTSTTEFGDVQNVEFNKLNDHLLQVRLYNDVVSNKYTEFKIFIWDMIVERPDIKPDIHDVIITNKVFVLGNQVVVSGGSTIDGPDASVIVRNNMSLTGSSVQYITTKNIYIDGNVSLGGGAGIGRLDGTSSIFITGNCTVTGTGRLYGTSIVDGDLTLSSPKLNGKIYVDGNIKILSGSYSDFLSQPVQLYYTGSLTLPRGFGNINATKVSSVQDIVFPEIMIPPMQSASWYAAKGYTSNTVSLSNMKYYGGSYTFNYNNGNTFNNVIIASKLNITISGGKNITGVLYAPNGEVIISGGSTFQGLIIAKKTTVSGDSHVTFKTPLITDLPF